MADYLDIVKKEYEIELDKKQSFETRAGLILALMGAICIFLFEKVDLTCVYQLILQQVTFLKLIKILSGFTVYISFLYTIIMLIKTIMVQEYELFEVNSIDETLWGSRNQKCYLHL